LTDDSSTVLLGIKQKFWIFERFNYMILNTGKLGIGFSICFDWGTPDNWCHGCQKL